MSHRLEVSLTCRLPGFSLEVEWTADEGVAVLFGPSGSGKSLTLRCLAGLVDPDDGRVVVDGRILFDARAGIRVPPQVRRVGYVFQGYALFPHLTVLANVAFGLKALPRREREARAAAVMARLGLTGLAQRYPDDLSGGQKQRVALGRALAVEPDLVLLDEPLSALDAPLRRALRDELGVILADWKVPAVLVTHDIAEAYQLGDRVIVYEAGRVSQSGPRSELLWRPATESVARILGYRNLLRGTVAEVAPDRIVIDWRGRQVEARTHPDRPGGFRAGSAVTFFVRPEDLRLIRKDGPAPDPDHHGTVLDGRVVRENDLGVTRTLFLRLGGPGEPAQGDFDLEIDVPRFVYEMLRIDREQTWQFSIHRGSLHVLPAPLVREGVTA
jgi:molybdate transport system ATP-binding protein